MHYDLRNGLLEKLMDQAEKLERKGLPHADASEYVTLKTLLCWVKLSPLEEDRWKALQVKIKQLG
jgi:hypothetical protein